MKRIYSIGAALLITVGVWAQAPEKMSYQAVVRDATNALVIAQTIGVQITVLQGSTIGTAVYSETQIPTTNANGQVSLEIGTGTVVSGDFTTIDWATDTYFMKTEIDLTGGSTYTITGTSQLMSVPYALHAKTAESVTSSSTETDPVFGASIAKGITAADTANWNRHTVDTDTTLDAAGVTALGFASGAHTVDTDTTLDAAGVTALGFTSGAHTVDTTLDAAGVTALGFTSGAHTVDTDTQLNEAAVDAFVANNGYTSYNIGEIKQTIGTLSAGWIRLEGQAISTLTANQQTNASNLGLSGNLPNAFYSVLVQNGSPLGSVTSTNAKTIAQNQLPNVALAGTSSSDGAHSHSLTIAYRRSNGGADSTYPGRGTDPEYSNNTHQTNVEPAHDHTIATSSINGGVTQQTLDVTPQSLSVNTYIYLGQ